MFDSGFHGSPKLFFEPIRGLDFGLSFTNSNLLTLRHPTGRIRPWAMFSGS